MGADKPENTAPVSVQELRSLYPGGGPVEGKGKEASEGGTDTG